MEFNTPKVGMVVPCFNEANRFNADYWKAIIQDTKDVKWVFVNDGSTDNTNEVLLPVSNLDNVTIINLKINKGKAEAIRVGMLSLNESKDMSGLKIFSGIGFVDSDGAFKKSDITNIIEFFIETLNINNHVKDVDAVIASRIKLSGHDIERNPLRHYLSRILITFLCSRWERAPYDTQCGLKIFNNNAFMGRALQQHFNSRWFFDIEILMRLQILKKEYLRIWEQPLMYWHEVGGSRIKISNYIKILTEVLQVKRIINKSVAALYMPLEKI